MSTTETQRAVITAVQTVQTVSAVSAVSADTVREAHPTKLRLIHHRDTEGGYYCRSNRLNGFSCFSRFNRYGARGAPYKTAFRRHIIPVFCPKQLVKRFFSGNYFKDAT